MNRLYKEQRTKIIAALVEDNSPRPTARMCDVSFNTVLKLVPEIGRTCMEYQDKLDQLAQQSVKKLKIDPIEEQRQYLVAQRMEQLTTPEQEAVHYILLHGEISVHNLRRSLGISYSDLRPVVQKLLVRENGDLKDRVCFINPELKSALESYFREH